MKPLNALRRLLIGTESTASYLQRIDEKFDRAIAGIENHAELLNRQFNRAIEAVAGNDGAYQRLDSLIAGLAKQSDLLGQKLDRLIDLIGAHDPAFKTRPPDGLQTPPEKPASNFRDAMQQMPLMIADRTYNTSHPGYDARLVRNFPAKILNFDPRCENPAFRALLRYAQGDEVPDQAWEPVLAEMLQEARLVPHSEQVFERRRFVEQYMAEIGRKYRAHYVPGWVNLDDALFLYWLVRQTKPRTIVQTGVCNGLSASFMMLALAKNGPEGTLNVIDLPPVFNPDDPAWTVEGKVYGVVIPEGKTTGWLVPDAYRDRFRVWNGDARELLPKLVDELDAIDLFYHDSDHTYDHMMFEFREAKKKLTHGGLVVGDDISWNASVWDFADEYGVPSYNFKGAVGVAFF
jgi:predicted O-methyltransferase YrrM